MDFEFMVPKILVKPILFLSRFFTDKKIVLVCKGYDDDWEYYTGLYWSEDKNLDANWYEDYQLWIKI